jgi:HPt (histidine-containing phosphotransfer) domain-containing protein
MAVEIKIDPGVIMSLIDLGGDDYRGLLRELFQLFISEAEKATLQISGARETADWVAISRVLHRLKSSCANVGGLETSRLSGALEQDLRQGNLADAESRLQVIVDQLASLKVALGQMIARMEEGLAPL